MWFYIAFYFFLFRQLARIMHGRSAHLQTRHL